MTSALGLKVRVAPRLRVSFRGLRTMSLVIWDLLLFCEVTYIMFCILSRHSTRKEFKMLIAGTKTGSES